MRVLVVEDDLTSRTLLTGVLTRQGYEVVTAVNGTEACDVLQRPDAPDLAILDWVLPEMEGPDVLRRVRAAANDNPPYILMLTSRDGKADIVAGLEAGANDYLTKPYNLGELRARLAVGCRMIEMQKALLASRDAVAHQACHDGLTGLLNRRAIIDRLHQEAARSDRKDSNYAVGMCDIDHFKRVNDTYGHQTGDEVLQRFAAIMVDSLRPYDFVGRVGGEEFLVIAPVESRQETVALFQRLCQRIAGTRLQTRSGPLSVTVSIGLACAAPGMTADEMLQSADVALYRAKCEGRNRVVHNLCGAD